MRSKAHTMHSYTNHFWILVNFGPISIGSLSHLGIALAQVSAIFPRKLHTQPFQTCNPVSMANQHCIVKHLDFCPFWAVAVATLAIVWAHVYCRASVSADFCPKNVQATSLWSIALVCQSPMKTDLTPINP